MEEALITIEPAFQFSNFHRQSIRPDLTLEEWGRLIIEAGKLLRLIFGITGEEGIQRAEAAYESSSLFQYLNTSADDYLIKLKRIYVDQGEAIEKYAMGEVDAEQFIDLILLTGLATVWMGQGSRGHEGMLREPIETIQIAIEQLRTDYKIA